MMANRREKRDDRGHRYRDDKRFRRATQRLRQRDRYGSKIVVAHRRGAAALCQTVVEHLGRRSG